MTRRRPAIAVRVAAGLGVALAAVAATGEERRLHERVENPNEESGPLVEQPAEGRNPAALRLPRDAGEVLEPANDPALRGEEQPFEIGRPPESAESHQRLDRWRPDLLTARSDDQLSYHSTFTPSIAPHKRISALDVVEADYTLSVASRTLVEVPVGGAALPDREIFWGSIVVRLVPGQPVPIPSVAPEARILSVRATPAAAVRFYRDGADNYYVVGDRAGETRVVFVTDAPAEYFGGPLPPEVRAGDVPRDRRPVVPAQVGAAVAQVAARLGLDRGAPLARNLARLVAYLRAFENDPLDGTVDGDRYLTLAFGRRGVCRHRAFVFVVTAQGLGIPARFVTNEVHAFAEVLVPTVGWVRIDLGGEARLSPETEAVVRHEPRAADPFPWPAGVREPGTEGNGGATGGGSGDLARRGAPALPGSAAAPAPRAPAAGVDAGPDVAGSDAGAAVDPASPEESTDTAAAGSEAPARPRLLVFLDQSTATVVRGESLSVAGAVQGEGDAAAHAAVTFWIRGGRRGQQIRLGRATCDAAGRFDARFAVPSTVPTGTYSLVARAEPASH